MSQFSDPPASRPTTPFFGVPPRYLLIVLACAVPVTIIAMVLGYRWFRDELAKADPIPGITVTVDPGGAPNPKSTEHAAHAFLNRRLRELGYTDSTENPLTIAVKFKKNGTEKYEVGAKTIEADRLRVELQFKNAAGKTKTIHIDPQAPGVQSVGPGDAGIGMNMAMYDRAVGELRKAKLPRIEDLK